MLTDKTEIDDFDILKEFHKNYISEKSVVELRVDDGEVYQENLPNANGVAGSAPAASTATNPATNEATSSTPGFPAGIVPSSTPALDLKTHVWKQISPQLTEACSNKTGADPKDRRDLVNLLARYLLFNLKDDRRSTCEAACRIICEKYPDTFCDKVEGTVYGRGWEGLLQQTYNALQYCKGLYNGKRGTQRRSAVTNVDGAGAEGGEESSTTNDKPKRKKIKAR